jgi:protein O-GlcNAc transferase
MARTGGTVICRCLGAMDSVALLSEIHPLGTRWFDPLRQAKRWFGLITHEELQRFRSADGLDFRGALEFLAERCEERGRHLVIRDWSHLDFTGTPYVTEPSYRFLTAERLTRNGEIYRAITVRHPWDQLISLLRLKSMQGRLELPKVLYGFRRFAELAAEHGFVRYEDFTDAPSEQLKELCRQLRIPFDPGYQTKWAEYRKITGDAIKPRREAIVQRPRAVVDEDLLRQVESNADYQAVLQLLGYQSDYGESGPMKRNNVPDDSLSENEISRDFERGNTLSGEEKWEEAEEHYRRVISSAPTHEWALNNLGYCLVRQKKNDEAAMYLRRCLKTNRTNERALHNLLTAIEGQEHKMEAVLYRRRLVDLSPQDPSRLFALANDLLACGRSAEAVHYYRRTFEQNPRHRVAISNYLLTLNYLDSISPEFVTREHFRLAQRWGGVRQNPVSFRQSRDPRRILRVGYVSPDFHNHPVGKTIVPIIAAHRRDRCEVVCYSDGKRTDRWTERTRTAASRFLDVHELDDRTLLQTIRDDEIDILVELQGHTSGRNRLAVLSAGAAPIQMAFLGYATTSGLDAVDFRITDGYCDPTGKTESFHTEKLIRMRRGFLCYEPSCELPVIDSLPFQRNGYVTFGSFNNPSKVSPTVLEMWTRILRHVPGSRLHVKYGSRFANEMLKEHWWSIFAAGDIAPERVCFFPAVPSLEEHLKAIGSVDIALDPYPYQGTHTTLETLSMSVPVITLMGETYVRRASSALLLRLGLDQYVNSTPDEYVQCAVSLAKDPRQMAQLRAEIRERFRQSEICDVAGYVSELENEYRNLWRDWCKRHPLPAESIQTV